MLSKDNELPTTTYQAKQLVCPLEFEVQKIRACTNDCIIYRGDEYENLDACPVCVHLVKEIDILRPVFLHNIFPVEKFVAVLKKYVRNCACPEGTIASGYAIEEVIEFYVDFIDDLKPIGVPKSRYEGRPHGKGTLGKQVHVCTNDDSFKKQITRFFNNPPWRIRISRNIRSSCPGNIRA
jgi:hypothetical protein